MKKLKMFCISLEPNHYNFIKSLDYVPVGLGEKEFNADWFRDKPNIKRQNIIEIKLLVPFGAFLNSFQINTPHAAATIVAP